MEQRKEFHDVVNFDTGMVDEPHSVVLYGLWGPLLYKNLLVRASQIYNVLEYSNSHIRKRIC